MKTKLEGSMYEEGTTGGGGGGGGVVLFLDMYISNPVTFVFC